MERWCLRREHVFKQSYRGSYAEASDELDTHPEIGICTDFPIGPIIE
jgi:hypothetical protein